MKYFRLNEEIYFVPGKRPSLYNLFTGDVYRISEDNAIKLMEAENGNSILKYRDDKFFELLKNKGYGDFYSDKVFIEKINLSPDWYDYLYFKPAPMMNRVTLKLANCQYKCENCNVNKSFLYVVDESNTLIYHPDKSRVGEVINDNIAFQHRESSQFLCYHADPLSRR